MGIRTLYIYSLFATVIICFLFAQSVNAISGTTTNLISGVNPSVSGQRVGFIAAVSPSTATGTVTFTIDGVARPAVTLVSGHATISSSTLSVGTHQITAKYSGDTNFASSTSSILNQTVNKASTTTTLTSSANPSVSGQFVVFTATVSAVLPGAGTPSGTVKFIIDNVSQPAVTLVSGHATISSSTLSVGTHQITAQYSGDLKFFTSTSSILNQTVSKASTTTTLTSSANPSVTNQSVTFTATVSAVLPGAGTPSGTVKFIIDNVSQPAVTLVSGHATISSSALSNGTHNISAQYSGNTKFLTSTSSILVQTVHSVNATGLPAVTASPPGGAYNSTQFVTLTANVTATIYYTMDGSTPSTASPVYASPISISNTTTLKFFGKDLDGNIGLINTQQYTITTTDPFSIDLFRGDSNQTSLITFFNKFTSSKDFVSPVSNADPTYYKQITAGNFTLGISQLAQTDSTIAMAKSSHVTYLTYDLEPGAGAEFQNYVNSTATVANKVHAAGLKLILAPRWTEIQSYGTQIAPYADMITMQLRYPLSSLPGGYVSWVSQYSTSLRQAAGHPIVIGEQVLTIPSSLARVNNYDPTDIEIGYNNTKQYVDYIQLFYFNQTYTDNTDTTITKDVIPYLSKFYKGIGMPGIS